MVNKNHIFHFFILLLVGSFNHEIVYSNQIEEGSIHLSKTLTLPKSTNHHLIIQFNRHVSPDERVSLQNHGIHFLHYLPTNRYIVYLNQKALFQLKKHSAYSGAAFIPSTWKIDSNLILKDYKISSMSEKKSTILVDLYFFETISLRQAQKILVKYDIPLVQSTKSFAASHSFQSINIPVRKISELAKENAVSQITPPSPPLISCNLNAQDTSNVDEIHPGGGTGYNLDGKGVTIALWDTSGVNLEHEQLLGRIIQKDKPTGYSTHATHVAGTLVASGNGNSQAQGMAPAANLLAFNMADDLFEMLKFEDQFSISNHSYKSAAGWEYNPKTNKLQWYGNENDPTKKSSFYGYYTNRSYQFDRILSQNNNIMVTSAGNDRQPFEELSHGDQTIYPQNGAINEGYDTLTSLGVTKNAITVGSIKDLTKEPPRPEESTMTSYSSWGPTNDGRIKPDLVTNGTSLLSTGSESTSSYFSMGGTSSSSPVAAGTLACLIQLYRREYQNTNPYSETIKTIALHTARDGGDAKGPDYRFGWGLLDARAAADFIQFNGYLGHHWDHQTYAENPITYKGKYNGFDPIKVTLVWKDPPPYIYDTSNGENLIRLVNDLDLTVEGPDGTHYPWTLNPNSPSSPARQDRANHRDNVEQVLIQKPQQGSYSIRIAGDVNLGNKQPFALCISGIQLQNKQPRVTLLHPLNVKPVSSTINIKAQVRHSSKINHVRFYVDNQLIDEQTLFPPQSDTIRSVSWDTQSWSNGLHTIKVEAIAMDNSINKQQREIVVFNKSTELPVIQPEDRPVWGYISALSETNEYQIQVSRKAKYQIKTTPAFHNPPLDTVLRLYRTDSAEDILLHVNDDVDESGLSSIQAILNPEQSYRLEVGTGTLAKGFYHLNVSISSEIPNSITSLPFNSLLEKQTIDQGETRWYSFTPPQSGEYFIETTYEYSEENSNIKLPLQMQLVDSLNIPSNLLSQNAAVSKKQSSLFYNFQVGKEYYLSVEPTNRSDLPIETFQIQVVQKNLDDVLLIERTINLDEVSLESSLIVTLKLTRKKDVPITSIELQESIPNKMKIQSVTPQTSFRSNSEQLQWNFPSFLDEEKTVQYQLTPMSYNSEKIQLEGLATYTIGKIYTIFSTQTTQGDALFSIVTKIPDWYNYH